jgi:tetratricopeptide (TPR) repeat protein
MKAIVPYYFAIALLFLPTLAAADEPGSGDFGCSLVRGAADLRVDGALSDWDSQTVAQPLKWSKTSSGELADDSTATARCLADDSFLYLGVAIRASSLRFETAPFNQTWRNDAVEVFISSQTGDPSTHIRTGLIRVSSDAFGRTVTEGSASVTDGVRTTRRFSYPLLWEAIGVKTGLQVFPSGYSVEVAIPRRSIGWTEAIAVARLSMNIRVRRSCGQKPCQAVMQASDDPYNSSPESDELYRPVSFGRPLPAAGSRLARGPKDESPSALVYGALLRLDTLDADGAVALLQESQDRQLLPMVGSALMAAGHLDSALSVFSGISPGESGDAVRLWVTEQAAYVHVLQGATSLAAGEYAALAASNNPAFQDIGVAGLIDLALADGRGDAAMATYRAAFGGSVAPGMRSGTRIANWLQKRGRVPEAIDVLKRLSTGDRAHDSERAWALFQLLSLYERSGDIENAVATGWQLQALAPPGDRSGEQGLKKLIATATFGRAITSATSSFSDSYRGFLEANPSATDPARRIAYAAELRWEGKSDTAAGLYADVCRETSARRKDRAAALLYLQRLHLESGQVERSVETGLTVQNAFPEDLNSRLASWQLIRAACVARGMPSALRRQIEDFGRALVKDIRSFAQVATDAVQRRAQALLFQFDKELNIQ